MEGLRTKGSTMRSDEERREERRQYEADVYYEAWRRGCSEPDLDRVHDAYYDGVSAESLCSRMQNEQNERRRQQTEEEYYSQQEQEEPNEQDQA